MRRTPSILILSAVTAGIGPGCSAMPGDEDLTAVSRGLSHSDKGKPAGSPVHKLIAWAVLPQSTRTPGPTSGQFIAPANGVVPPFPNAQPIKKEVADYAPRAP